MNSIRIKDKASNNLDVRGAKALFENGIRRQREASPAPARMTAPNMTGKNGKGSISSFKEKFEQFTAPRKDTPVLLRKAVSADNVTSEKLDLGKPGGTGGAKFWLQAKTKIYEQLNNEKVTPAKRSKSHLDVNKNSQESIKVQPSVIDKKDSSDKDSKDGNSKRTSEKIEIAPLTERISKFKSSSSKPQNEENTKNEMAPSNNEKKAVKDLRSNFLQGKLSEHAKTQNTSASSQNKSAGSTLQNKTAMFESVNKDKVPTACISSATNKFKVKSEDKVSVKKTEEPHKVEAKSQLTTKEENHNKIETKSSSAKTAVLQQNSDNKMNSIKVGEKNGKKINEIKDHSTAKSFMEDLITAIDNEQHVPMKQLIDLFETMKKDNNQMKESLERMRLQLDKTDIDTLNKALESKLSDTVQKLNKAQAQIQELSRFKEALHASEEHCEELEELNHQHLQEIEYLKLEMNEMRDQFHDDEVHETIILQQRLDDMARSLRIIHFRLKKADARLQETEREKETLLEEIRLLQGGTFTDEEIKRMQALEGDLQSAKEVSVQLHNELERSEERREKLGMEATKLRDELKAAQLENDRLRNNIQHLREQMSNDAAVSDAENKLSPVVAGLVRQSSSTDMDTLKNNLEAAIERENDLKEQLKFAEEEAKMLRKRLRDIEHENEALNKQLRKLTQIAHTKGNGGRSPNKITSESVQTELIELENKELRNNNDKLHHKIDSLQSQVKSLQQKLELMQHEQGDGPLSLSKNSIYYETKFELMSKEVEELRWQLQEREKDYRKLRDDTDSRVKRDQLRRAITIDCDTVDTKKQLDIVKQEADLLRERLQQLETDNNRLAQENKKFQLVSSPEQPSLEETNQLLTSKVNTLEKENTELLAQLEQHKTDANQQKLLNEIESENTRLITELSYYRKANPEVASLANKLHQSEEKILSYEEDISKLKQDMFKMEHDLQDDINSLTMKNSILRSLLEAINQHEGGDSSSSLRNTNSVFTTSPPTTSMAHPIGGASNMDLDIESDSLISRHISRLPHDIQKQFREKIESLETQLKEERERAREAESLLQQVKLHLRSCVLSSPLAQLMQPRKAFRYPNPPPSLIIKPSVYNSPSHTNNKSDKLTSSHSTPERMKVGQSLVAQMYLGDFPAKALKQQEVDANSGDEMLTVSIQQNGSSTHMVTQLQNNFPSSCQQKNIESTNPNGQCKLEDEEADKTEINGCDGESPYQLLCAGYEETAVISMENDSRQLPISARPKTRALNGNCRSHSITGNEHERIRKSSLRKDFFDNYNNHISRGYKAKKRVSFALPSIERDVSDLSISSHLSAASDCTVSEDDDNSELLTLQSV